MGSRRTRRNQHRGLAGVLFFQRPGFPLPERTFPKREDLRDVRARTRRLAAGPDAHPAGGTPRCAHDIPQIAQRAARLQLFHHHRPPPRRGPAPHPGNPARAGTHHRTRRPPRHRGAARALRSERHDLPALKGKGRLARRAHPVPARRTARADPLLFLRRPLGRRAEIARRPAEILRVSRPRAQSAEGRELPAARGGLHAHRRMDPRPQQRHRAGHEWDSVPQISEGRVDVPLLGPQCGADRAFQKARRAGTSGRR